MSPLLTQSIQKSAKALDLVKFDWLYYFVVLAQHQSFSDAAKDLYLTQQALSKAISQLETYFQVPLIQRHPWRLTAFGQIIYQQAQHILKKTSQIETDYLLPVECSARQSLSLANVFFLDKDCLQDLRYLQESSSLNIHLRSGFQVSEIEKALLLQEVDCAILPFQVNSLDTWLQSQIQFRYFNSSPMCIAVSPDYLWQHSEYQDHWQSIPQIHLSQSESLNDLFGWPTQATGPIVATVDFMSALDLCCDGHGAILVPQSAIESNLKRSDLTLLPAPDLGQFTQYLLWHAQAEHNPIFQNWLTRLEQKIK